MRQENFAFMEQNEPKNIQPDKKNENEKWQSWLIPIGKPDQYNDREEIKVEFDRERKAWRKDGEVMSLEKIQNEMGEDWVNAVSKSPSMRKAVEESEKN